MLVPVAIDMVKAYVSAKDNTKRLIEITDSGIDGTDSVILSQMMKDLAENLILPAPSRVESTKASHVTANKLKDFLNVYSTQRTKFLTIGIDELPIEEGNEPQMEFEEQEHQGFAPLIDLLVHEKKFDKEVLLYIMGEKTIASAVEILIRDYKATGSKLVSEIHVELGMTVRNMGSGEQTDDRTVQRVFASSADPDVADLFRGIGALFGRYAVDDGPPIHVSATCKVLSPIDPCDLDSRAAYLSFACCAGTICTRLEKQNPSMPQAHAGPRTVCSRN